MTLETRAIGLESLLPEIKDFDAGNQLPHQELLQGVIESLKISGGCLIRHFVSSETVKELNDDFAPYFDKSKPLKSENHFPHAYDGQSNPD